MFCDQFQGSQYKNNFTYNGLRALYDYLEELDNEGILGDSFDPLDIVALCCDFSEEETSYDHAQNYSKYSPSDIDDRGFTEEESIEFLRDNTTVIEFDGGVIIQNF